MQNRHAQCRQIFASIQQQETTIREQRDEHWNVLSRLQQRLRPERNRLSDIVQTLRLADQINGIPTSHRVLSLMQDAGAPILQIAQTFYERQLGDIERQISDVEQQLRTLDASITSHQRLADQTANEYASLGCQR